MIELVNLKGHSGFQSGYSYSGGVKYSGKLLKDVLKEISEFTKDKEARYMKYNEHLSFGNPKSKGCDCWRIELFNEDKGETITLISSWVDKEKFVTDEYDDYYVRSISINGGWYCYYDFTICVSISDSKFVYKIDYIYDGRPGVKQVKLFTEENVITFLKEIEATKYLILNVKIVERDNPFNIKGISSSLGREIESILGYTPTWMKVEGEDTL